MLKESRSATVENLNPSTRLPIVLGLNGYAAELAIPLEPHVLPFLIVHFYYFLSFYVLGLQDG